MNRQVLATQLRSDEGQRLQVYLDTRGFLTTGVGHLCRPEDHLRLGDAIPQARCDAWLAEDIQTALDGCARLVAGWEALPEEAQLILANMAFQLGEAGLRKFRCLLAAVAVQDWAAAAVAMRQSLWHTQTTQRAERLAVRMEAHSPWKDT